MKVSVKGVVTIPARIRSMFHIRPGDEVEFVEEGERVFLTKVTGSRAFLLAELVVSGPAAGPNSKRSLRGGD